jgi:hypothetical protein
MKLHRVSGKILCAVAPVLFTFAFICSVLAADLKGTVVEVSGLDVKIRIASDYVPNVDDKVEISFTIPGGDQLSVGTWQVTEVQGDLVSASVVENTGKPAVGQSAVIYSSDPKPVALPSAKEDIDRDIPKKRSSEIQEATITKDLLESSAQIEDFLITEGPNLIAQGQYNRVLTLIDHLPGITRTNTQIRTLECFANLKGWVSDRNRLCKKKWSELRHTLIKSGDNKATPILATMLRDGDPYVRMYSAELLGYIGDKRALNDLKEVWENDKNKSVKKYAKWAYTLISRKKF